MKNSGVIKSGSLVSDIKSGDEYKSYPISIICDIADKCLAMIEDDLEFQNFCFDDFVKNGYIKDIALLKEEYLVNMNNKYIEALKEVENETIIKK